MFERFSQYEDASLARGGLGLGLSIVRTLLEDMGGTVGYERVDGWSRFVVELPTAIEIRGRAAERVSSTAPGQVTTSDG
jgi:signal transduction histidine kinase